MSNTTVTQLSQLTPDPKNPRKRGQRAERVLVASLQEVGAARSIVIDEDGNILAGNGTVQAAAELGMDRVKVIDADGETIVAVRRTGLSEEQKRRLSVLDNRTGELADWDTDTLAALVVDGLDITDLWAPDEWEALLGSLPDEAKVAPDDFKEYDETIDTERECPKCGYKWSGGK